MTAKAFWRWVAGIAIVVLALGVAGALAVAVGQSPQRGFTLVEILKLFLSWPAMAGALALLFGFGFRREVALFLQNVGSIRLPGGTEILSKQPPPPTAAPPTEDTPAPAPGQSIALTPEDQQVIQGEIAEILKKSEAIEERAGQLEEFSKQLQTLLNSKQQELIYWWFQYLSLFYVPNSKRVLGWFSTLAWPQTREQFHEIWKWIIPNEGERESILNALLFHQLLQVNGQTLAITDSGRAFVQYLQQQGFWFVPPR